MSSKNNNMMAKNLPKYFCQILIIGEKVATKIRTIKSSATTSITTYNK
jgi:hypothetical protein